jgi:hypothetical protein
LRFVLCGGGGGQRGFRQAIEMPVPHQAFALLKGRVMAASDGKTDAGLAEMRAQLSKMSAQSVKMDGKAVVSGARPLRSKVQTFPMRK